MTQLHFDINFTGNSLQDCELVGLKPFHSRPEHYLWQYIAVPPVAIRPSVNQDGARSAPTFSPLLRLTLRI